jgi:hypothetical protein
VSVPKRKDRLTSSCLFSDHVESRFRPPSRLYIHEQSNCEQSQKHRHVLFSITCPDSEPRFCYKYLSLPATTAKLKIKSRRTPFPSLAPRPLRLTSGHWFSLHLRRGTGAAGLRPLQITVSLCFPGSLTAGFNTGTKYPSADYPTLASSSLRRFAACASPSRPF